MRSLVASGKGKKAIENETAVKNEVERQALEDSLGRLIIEEEKSRYVSGSAWQNLADQVGDLRTLLEDEQINDEDSPNTMQYLTDGIFNPGGVMKVAYSQTGLPFLWQTYVRFVDPVMKVIYVPSVQPMIEGVLNSSQPPSKSSEALLAAIKFCAVTSLSDEDCWSNFSTSREILLDMFKAEVQATLNAANFLSSHDITSLQAFMMFLFCNRRREKPSAMWVSSGIAIRVAQSIGLHRDGAIMRLPVFVTEIRRRLFWELRMLDIACAEDCGFLPTHIFGADTRLPTHCNDSDLSPSNAETPPERSGFTDITYVMIRYEMTYRLHGYVPHPGGRSSMGILTGDTHQFPEQSKAVSDFISVVQNNYLPSCNPTIPFHRVTRLVGSIVLAKMSLISQYPMFQSSNRRAPISDELKHELFNSSCEILETTDSLANDPETRGWAWMMETYVHWHPVAYILNELCMNPRHEQAGRAWRAIDMAYANSHGLTFEANLALWKPLAGLLSRAKAQQRSQQNAETYAQYLTPASLSETQVSSANAGMQEGWVAEDNFVPGDENLMTLDLRTPFATMEDFMTGANENYGMEQVWWIDGDMTIPGNGNEMRNPRVA